MSIQGGGDRKDLRPHNPNDKQVIGTHRGPFEALNVKNPKPGFHYYYARRKPSDVQRFMNAGWEPVRSGDPEQWGSDMPPEVGEMLDGVKAYGDVILMRIREDKFRAIREEKEALAKAAREGGTSEFINKGHQRARQLGSSRPKKDLYFESADHGTVADED
jgi:hypothetical protein